MRQLVLGCVSVVACGRGAHGAPNADTSATAPPSLARSASAGSPPRSPLNAPPSVTPSPAGYAASVRAERWTEARAALEALPEASRAEPENRFVHARVVFELGDAQASLGDLEGLESALPVLAPQIAAARAYAQLKAGPFSDAAQYFERRGDTEGLLLAASAYDQAGALPQARLAVERALGRLGQSKRVRDAEVRARAVRAQIARQMADNFGANADFRWLAVSAPLRAEADVAAQALERAGGLYRLSKSERMERASVMAEAGRVAATDAELALVATAPGVAPPIGRLTFLRALALYASRGQYSKSAELFERAAREDPVAAPKSSFYAARALSRAQSDDRAITGYERVCRQFPRTAWAEQAQYLSARLRYIAGDFAKARSLYDVYLAQFGKGARFGSDATYERALCALETDQAVAAAVSFGRLAERAADRRSKARLRYLEALSLALANQKQKAVEAFTRVAQGEPLSFFGLAARARLQIVGAELPPLIADSHAAAHPDLDLKLPPDVALLNHLGLARDAERELRSEESSFEREYAPRGSEALCEAYGQLGVAQRRYRLAQDVVRGEALDHAPSEGNAWAWHCVYPSPYPDLVQAAAQREGISAALIYAVMRQESAFDPGADSPAGAYGLLQLIAPTARRIADAMHEPFTESALLTPDANVRYGASYLARLSGHFAGNLALVAASYNAGPEAVFRWLSAPEKIGLDVFVARIPFEETRTYVERVLGNLARYQYLEGGAAAVAALQLDLPHAPSRPDDLF